VFGGSRGFDDVEDIVNRHLEPCRFSDGEVHNHRASSPPMTMALKLASSMSVSYSLGRSRALKRARM
jgi:hypothetical protein